ncbi:MAG: SMR family transporter [Syntrophomonadaceae bacterium]|nr:SMR family transporter [Syntrophomonadaceae bacterium]
MKLFIVLLLAILCNAFANVLIKFGMQNTVAGTAWKHVLGMLSNIPLLSGIFLFGLALIFYSWVLGRMSLSIAYPIMTSVGFLIVILCSWLFFKENITWVQIIGSILILSGVWMVAQGIK